MCVGERAQKPVNMCVSLCVSEVIYTSILICNHTVLCVCVRAGDSVSARVFVFQFVFCFPLYD